MSESSRNQEPSMEEILSSIRRIIADEEGGDSPAPPLAASRPAPGAERQEDEEVLELTDVVEPARHEPPAAPPPPREAPRPRIEEPTRSTAPMTESTHEGLISPTTASASTQALSRLTRAANTAEDRGASPLSQLTVERLLTDMLTPMLKSWLDENLPQIVERVVEQEVKKLARRAELL
jgi:cell pole-organizing protein PopZ